MLKMKKPLSLLLAFALIFLLAGCSNKRDNTDDGFSYDTPPTSENEELSETYAGFFYRINDDKTATITGYDSIAKSAVIPDMIGTYPVTEIAERACFENEYLQEIKIPDSVTAIGSEAFSGCHQLSTVKLSKNLTSVGGRAFHGTPFLTDVTDEFFTVGDGILLKYNGSATEVTVPEGIKSISSAFENNALVTKVTLPSTLREIGGYAFISCTSLEIINIPEGVTAIGECAFAKCISLAEISIPDTVTSMGNMCYLYCSSAKSLKLSGSLEEIPTSAFQSCSSLTEVIIPDSVKLIGDQAFLKCVSLTSVTIADSTAEFGNIVFANCSPALTVACTTGSAAEEYCKLNNISVTLK